MRLLRFILAGCVGLVLGGCAGYKVGPTNGLKAGEKSVQFIPFANRTLEPRLTDAVTAALHKQLQRDGTYRLATHDDGNIVVSGVISDYDRREQTVVSTDTIKVQDYRLALTAQVTARDRATGKVILDKAVTGFALMQVGSDLPSVERQTLPLLATDLARRITALLTDGNW